MKGLIIPLLVLAGTFWVGLPERPTKSAQRPKSPATALNPATANHPKENLEWLVPVLGQLPPVPALAAISLPVEGLDLLADDSPSNLATLAELRRWQGTIPWAVDEIQIQVHRPDEGGAIPLTAKFQGVSGAVIPILEHLLASPFRQGYLLDPSYLRLNQDDAGILHVIYRVRVLAADHFLGGMGR